VHPHAEAAAEAAEAVGAQGHFWKMHHLLYENQRALDAPDLVAYAVAAGADREQFNRDLSDGKFQPRVREDFMSGVHSGVNGTPTFFINDRRYDGPYEMPSLMAAIKHLL
jgi:protein-disulfide isomerase